MHIWLEFHTFSGQWSLSQLSSYGSIAILKLTQPLLHLINSKDPTVISSPSNCSLADVMAGAAHITDPFTVELPILIACFMVELWSRFLPFFPNDLTVTQHIKENCPEDHQITQQSSWFSVFSSWEYHRKDTPEIQPLLEENHQSKHRKSTGFDLPSLGESVPKHSLQVEEGGPHHESPIRTVAHLSLHKAQ